MATKDTQRRLIKVNKNRYIGFPKYDICEHTVSKFTNAYIISDFRNIPNSGMKCECELTSNSQILVRLVDMNVIIIKA